MNLIIHCFLLIFIIFTRKSPTKAPFVPYRGRWGLTLTGAIKCPKKVEQRDQTTFRQWAWYSGDESNTLHTGLPGLVCII